MPLEHFSRVQMKHLTKEPGMSDARPSQVTAIVGRNSCTQGPVEIFEATDVGRTMMFWHPYVCLEALLLCPVTKQCNDTSCESTSAYSRFLEGHNMQLMV